MKTKKIIFVIVVLAFIFVVGGGIFLFVGAKKPWYTAYTSPFIVQEHEGKSYRTPFATLKILSRALRKMSEDEALKQDALIVEKKIPMYALLLHENYATAQEMKIDFISSLHYSWFTNDQQFMGAVKESQDAVLDILLKKNYDTVGKEGSWFNPLNSETLRQENLIGLKRMGIPNTEESRQRIEDTITRLHPFDGVMRYHEIRSNAELIGIEDQELFYLHATVVELMRAGGINNRLKYQEYDRVLVWVRSEIALAKLIADMKKKGKQTGVFVMGQNHRQQFEVLAKELGLNAAIHQTVPPKYQDDDSP